MSYSTIGWPSLLKISCSSFCIWLLQTLYAAMHEPDGVKGVNALRREEPSLREQILEHESIGLLRDATACYDRAIQLESDQVHMHIHTHTEINKQKGRGEFAVFFFFRLVIIMGL